MSLRWRVVGAEGSEPPAYALQGNRISLQIISLQRLPTFPCRPCPAARGRTIARVHHLRNTRMTPSCTPAPPKPRNPERRLVRQPDAVPRRLGPGFIVGLIDGSGRYQAELALLPRPGERALLPDRLRPGVHHGKDGCSGACGNAGLSRGWSGRCCAGHLRQCGRSAARTPASFRASTLQEAARRRICPAGPGAALAPSWCMLAGSAATASQ